MTKPDSTQRNDATVASAPASYLCTRNDLVNLLVREATALLLLLEESAEMQWTAAPRERPADDTAERSSGPHSDPTADLALNEPRLALSQQIKRCDRMLRDAAIGIGGERRGLARQIDAWRGQ